MLQVAGRNGGFPFSAGVFFVRNSPWVHNFLDVWYGNFNSPLVSHPHWEQAAFVTLLSASKWAAGHGVAPVQSCELGLDPFGACAATGQDAAARSAVVASVVAELHQRVLVHPQRWMNSYPPTLSTFIRDWQNVPAHAAYSDGDFVVSFSGCNFLLGATACSEMLETFYTLSERLNGPQL